MLLVAGVVELFARVGSPGPQSVAIMAIGYSTLYWRRSRPVVAGSVMFAMWILFNVAGDDVKSVQMPLIAALFAGYAMGAYTDGRDARIAPFVIVIGVTGVTATWEEQVLTDYIFPTALRAHRLARRPRRAHAHAARPRSCTRRPCRRRRRTRRRSPARRPTSAAGSRARCTTSSPTPCR